MIKRYKNKRQQRKLKVRASVARGNQLPRLIIYRSNKYIYAQLYDSINRRVVGGKGGKEPGKLGQEIAALAKKLKLSKVVFDRGPYKYHGKVKAVAEAAREGGLSF